MAKFSYRLQPLLNVKKQTEEGLKYELGKAVQKLEHEKYVLTGFETEKQQCFNQMTCKCGSPVPVRKLREYSAYVSVLRDRIVLQKENINTAQNNVDIHREQLVKVVQEKKMLEKLREKKYDEYLKDNLKVEQSTTDEVVSFKNSKG